MDEEQHIPVEPTPPEADRDLINPLEAGITPIKRRHFLKKAATLALGGVATLNWLAACGENTAPPATANPTANPTTAPTQPPPTGTSTPVAPTATPVPTPVPTATPVPATATPAPSPTPAFKPLTFGVVGDIRTAGPKPPQVAYQILDRLKADNPQAIILVGDIINAGTSAPVVREQWNNVNQAIAELTPGTILPTVGNHETNGIAGVLPYFNEAFPALPANGPEKYRGLTYSYDAGSVHFVSLTSEHPSQFHYIGDQLDWLEKDLKANQQPYTFVFSHDPAFPVGPHTGSSLDAYPKDRDKLWKLMQTYKVSAFICGHEHLYNRSQQGGLTQLVIGTSGSAIYGGYGGEFYHYGVFQVAQEGVAVKIFDSLGKVRDTFSLL
jgi:3',5'-cyclic-AMP phosphodiesterase